MRLYLIQHGMAVPEEQDPQKPLSMEGIENTKKMARFLKEKDLKVDRIWHSKKMRSVQTAQMISESITCSEIEERDDINPNDPVDRFREEIQALNADLMIVGHLPFLQKLAALLLTGSHKSEMISFKNSGVVCLEYQEAWKLMWAVPPHII